MSTIYWCVPDGCHVDGALEITKEETKNKNTPTILLALKIW